MEYAVKVQEQSIVNELVYKNRPVLKYAIKYPVFSSDKFRHFIGGLNRYYRNQALAFKNYCHRILYPNAASLLRESKKQDFPFHEYEFNSTYTLTTNQNCTLSLYFDQGQYTGGANGTTKRLADSWDLKNHRRITLSELFPNNKPAEKFIESEINKQIAEQITNNESYYFDNYEKLVPEYFDSKNFFITPNSTTVFFQEITIAPHSAGIVTFDIPNPGDENACCLSSPQIRFDLSNPGEESACCLSSPQVRFDDNNPYEIRSKLLMEASNEVGVPTPEDAANVWAKGLMSRNGAMQYIVMTDELKNDFELEMNPENPSWVTGVSSPWITHFEIIQKDSYPDKSISVSMKFDTATSDGFFKSYHAKLHIEKSEGFWRISKISGDPELGIINTRI